MDQTRVSQKRPFHPSDTEEERSGNPKKGSCYRCYDCHACYEDYESVTAHKKYCLKKLKIPPSKDIRKQGLIDTSIEMLLQHLTSVATVRTRQFANDFKLAVNTIEESFQSIFSARKAVQDARILYNAAAERRKRTFRAHGTARDKAYKSKMIEIASKALEYEAQGLQDALASERRSYACAEHAITSAKHSFKTILRRLSFDEDGEIPTSPRDSSLTSVSLKPITRKILSHCRNLLEVLDKQATEERTSAHDIMASVSNEKFPVEENDCNAASTSCRQNIDYEDHEIVDTGRLDGNDCATTSKTLHERMLDVCSAYVKPLESVSNEQFPVEENEFNAASTLLYMRRKNIDCVDHEEIVHTGRLDDNDCASTSQTLHERMLDVDYAYVKPTESVPDEIFSVIENERTPASTSYGQEEEFNLNSSPLEEIQIVKEISVSNVQFSTKGNERNTASVSHGQEESANLEYPEIVETACISNLNSSPLEEIQIVKEIVHTNKLNASASTSVSHHRIFPDGCLQSVQPVESVSDVQFSTKENGHNAASTSCRQEEWMDLEYPEIEEMVHRSRHDINASASTSVTHHGRLLGSCLRSAQPGESVSDEQISVEGTRSDTARVAECLSPEYRQVNVSSHGVNTSR